MKSQQVLIVHPVTNEQVDALKAFMQALKIRFEVEKEQPYNPEFVNKIQKSRQDHKADKGKVVTIEQLNGLWK